MLPRSLTSTTGCEHAAGRPQWWSVVVSGGSASGGPDLSTTHPGNGQGTDAQADFAVRTGEPSDAPRLLPEKKV